MSALARLVPDGAAWAEMHDQGQDVDMRAREALLVAAAVHKRQREFALGRHCAHAALSKLGVATEAILRGRQSEPLWPSGVVGSISHTQGYAAAIVAPEARYAGIGLDAERIGGVTPKLEPKICTLAERALLESLAADERARCATLLFSAKEAVYKASQRVVPLSLIAIPVTLGVLSDGVGDFIAHDGLQMVTGRFAVEHGLALTCAWRVALLVPALDRS